MPRQAKKRETKPICLLKGTCYHQHRNARSKFKRCGWRDTCNQKGPANTGGRSLAQMRMWQFKMAEFRIGVVPYKEK